MSIIQLELFNTAIHCLRFEYSKLEYSLIIHEEKTKEISSMTVVYLISSNTPHRETKGMPPH